jgi:hypothetical protein
MIMKFDNKTF